MLQLLLPLPLRQSEVARVMKHVWGKGVLQALLAVLLGLSLLLLLRVMVELSAELRIWNPTVLLERSLLPRQQTEWRV